MLPEIKRCERCYRPISWEDKADWYSHIRIKYCDECRPIVDKEKAAARLKRFRERQKEAAKVRDQRLKDLELENRILRDKLKAVWEENSKEGKSDDYNSNSAVTL